ncbi:MAG: DegV family protein [Gudongella sp.]|nr:DegV family protein [Gudongella sp.]
MNLKILCDSACDLPEDIISELGIDVLPIMVINGEKSYRDRIDISPKEVYDNMREGVVYKTAQITPLIFQNKFEELTKDGSSVIYIGFSSGLSSTFQSANLAKLTIEEEKPGVDIEVIDTKSASGGYGFIVHEAAKALKNGKTKEEVIEIIHFNINNIDHIFTVDDIEYLRRGGRVSKTNAVLGGMLNIKPILEVLDGNLVVLEKVRGRNKVHKTMVELMEQRSVNKDFSDKTVFIFHGDDIEAAEKLKELIEEKLGVKNFLISEVGAVIGAHTGPGVLTLFYIK